MRKTDAERRKRSWGKVGRKERNRYMGGIKSKIFRESWGLRIERNNLGGIHFYLNSFGEKLLLFEANSPTVRLFQFPEKSCCH